MRVSIGVVAARAGVSKTTVSHVLNGTRFVNPETRTKVETAIAELGYYPSSVARSLTTRKTATIAVVVSDISNPFFTAVVRGVEDGLQGRDYQLILCNTDEDVDKQERYLRALLSKRVEGIIIAATGDPSSFLQIVARHIPTLFIDRQPPGRDEPTLSVDNEAAAYDAVMHLSQHGHRRIAAVVGLPQVSTSAERLAGYRRALSDSAVAFDASLVCTGNSRIEGGMAAIDALLALPDPPTAIFAANNLMTLGVLKLLGARGLRCPQDVALVGFDDHEWASCFTPPLTVVRQPTYDMGQAAVAVLLNRIHGGAAAPLPRMHAELVIRGSCGEHGPAAERR
jgi:LacI family transcriptional regulator